MGAQVKNPTPAGPLQPYYAPQICWPNKILPQAPIPVGSGAGPKNTVVVVSLHARMRSSVAPLPPLRPLPPAPVLGPFSGVARCSSMGAAPPFIALVLSPSSWRRRKTWWCRTTRWHEPPAPSPPSDCASPLSLPHPISGSSLLPPRSAPTLISPLVLR